MSTLKKIWDEYTGMSFTKPTVLGSPYPWILLAVIFVLSSVLSGDGVDLLLWSLFLLLQGAACWYGYRTCDRAHCRITGPGFVLVGLLFLLTGLGILPIITLGVPFDFYTALILLTIAVAFVYEFRHKAKTGSYLVDVKKRSAENEN